MVMVDWPDRSTVVRGISAVIVLISLIGAIAAIVSLPVVYQEFGEAGIQGSSVVATGLLSLALVVLYFQQYSIQERQTDLMEQRYQSWVDQVGVITTDRDYVYMNLKNAGRGAAQEVFLRTEIVGDTGSVEIEPGVSPLTAVEGDSSLQAFSPPREFKGKVSFSQPGDDKTYPFTRIVDSLSRVGIEEATVRFTLEITDENTDSGETKERWITDKGVELPEPEEHELEAEDGETLDKMGVPSTTFSEALKPDLTSESPNILRRDSELVPTHRSKR